MDFGPIKKKTRIGGERDRVFFLAFSLAAHYDYRWFNWKGIYGLAPNNTANNSADIAGRAAQRSDNRCKQHDHD